MIKLLDSQHTCGLDGGMTGRMRTAGFDDDRPTTTAMLGIACALPILDAAVNLQHRLIIPRVVSRLGCEVIPIGLVTARPGHHVDARAATENLSMDSVNALPLRFGFRSA